MCEDSNDSGRFKLLVLQFGVQKLIIGGKRWQPSKPMGSQDSKKSWNPLEKRLDDQRWSSMVVTNIMNHAVPHMQLNAAVEVIIVQYIVYFYKNICRNTFIYLYTL